MLVAEDEPIVRNVVRISLEGAGYFVLAGCDGEEALELSHVFPGAIHLLLSDISMPKMNGFELRKHIMAERPHTAVLLMSGQLPAATESVFLPEPFTPPELVAAGKRLLS